MIKYIFMIYGKKLEQSKYQYLEKKMRPISKEAGYDVIEMYNDEIIPVSEMDDNNQ